MIKILILLSLVSQVVYAKKRRPAQSLVSSELVVFSYSGGNKKFGNIKVGLTPFTKSIEFKSSGDEYVFDCKASFAKEAWVCSAPCETGRLEVLFVKGFTELRVKPFRIKPRKCDGTESREDPVLRSEKELVLRLK